MLGVVIRCVGVYMCLGIIGYVCGCVYECVLAVLVVCGLCVGFSVVFGGGGICSGGLCC